MSWKLQKNKQSGQITHGAFLLKISDTSFAGDLVFDAQGGRFNRGLHPHCLRGQHPSECRDMLGIISWEVFGRPQGICVTTIPSKPALECVAVSISHNRDVGVTSASTSTSRLSLHCAELPNTIAQAPRP